MRRGGKARRADEAYRELAGTLGIGIGFGSQNGVSRFVSGLVIALEQPVRIGGRVAAQAVEGEDLGTDARGAVAVPKSRDRTGAHRRRKENDDVPEDSRFCGQRLRSRPLAPWPVAWRLEQGAGLA